MNPIDLLSQPADVEFTQDEEELITRLLAQAYRMDECAATSPEVKRLADKVRQRMSKDEPGQDKTL